MKYFFLICSNSYQKHLFYSLIAPLPYAAEARPYFTIHDSEFKEFTQRQQGPVPIILGVTNPFFSKTLQHWPHLIRMSDNNNGKCSSKMLENFNFNFFFLLLFQDQVLMRMQQIIQVC